MDLLNEIKKAIKSVEPDAEIYLFGSRARGDFKEDSDWDLLILLSGLVTWERKDKIIDVLYDIELSESQIFNRIVRSKIDWYYNPWLHVSPFYKNVKKDAVVL